MIGFQTRHFALAALAACASLASAVPVPIVNPSFEDDDLGNGGVTSGNPTGWNGTGYLDRNGVSGFATLIEVTPDPTDGEQLGWSNGGNARQVLSTNLAANTVYTMTVDIGDRTDLNFAGVELRLGAGATFGTNLVPGVVVANTTPVNTAAAGDGWQTWISTFSTGAAPAGLGQPIRIELVNTTSDIQVLWDNVRLDASEVPEPAGLALAVGLGVLAASRRRHR